MRDILAVVPSGRWAYWESANLRGRPATHAIDLTGDQGRTLCGKNPDGWNWYGIPVEQINCKVCLRMSQKGQK